IFTVHTIPDLEKITDFLDRRQPKKAAVIGAGFIGLELGEALTKRGIQVVMLEALDAPIAAWPEMARNAVVKKLMEQRLVFLPRTSILEVQKKDQVFHLRTDDKTIESEVVFSVVGTTPATEFCGRHFDMLKNRALQIDAFCRTSIPDIFAAGDCASVNHLLLPGPVYMPLGSTANKLGRIAGLNMAGKNIRFPGIAGTQIFKFFDLSLAKTGLSREEAEREGMEAVTFSAARMDKAGYYPGADNVEMQLTFEKASNTLIGALVVCRGNAAQFIDPAAVAVTGKLRIAALAWLDAAYTPPFAPVWNVLVSAAFKGFTP
ncbi:MAG: FAD-dependent oxidoreductase, partial [Candidatus Aminicenantes bacterium]|nr:FAD-dependent oxidoreductase [Candidatus Aminicenantes bacterium]